MKHKINTLIVLSLCALVIAGLFGSHTAFGADTLSNSDQQACYDKYNGHGTGQGTDNQLTSALSAAYDKSNCDSSKGGPCTLNTSSQGAEVNCAQPSDDANPSSSTDCSKYSGLTQSTRDTSCVYAGSTDPALRQCNKASDPSQSCDIMHKYINPAISVLSALIGLVATAAIIYGGIMYAYSGGDPSKVQKGKSLIRTAISGIVIYVLAWSFLQWLVPGGIFH